MQWMLFLKKLEKWWGGWWEHLVRTVRNALKFALGRAIGNFRLLTYISSNLDELFKLFHLNSSLLEWKTAIWFSPYLTQK